jgi:hypothetical protein
MNEIDLDRAQREESRWRILRALDASRPIPLSETVLHRTLADIELPISPHALRRELAYLRDKQLVLLAHEDGPTWLATLTVAGVDVVEYSAPAPVGIARPKKWW